MARAFLPCVYREWEGYSIYTMAYHTYYEVTELLPASVLDTREESCLLTRDCHQYQINREQTTLEPLHLDVQLPLNSAKRAQLFGYFYATLAD